jgi:hypothetical protein
MKKDSPISRSGVSKFWIIFFIVIIIAAFALGPISPGRVDFKFRPSGIAQQAREIGLCLFQYAQDHDGHYPEGKTSTEVFQQLIDERYVTDPEIFFVYLPGKVRPQSSWGLPSEIS